MNNNIIKFNDSVEFIPGIKVVKLTATTKMGTYQYQLKQRIKTTYVSGESLMNDDSFSTFEVEDQVGKVYDGTRYCLKTFPARFDTKDKVQEYLNLPENMAKAYIKENYGYNPLSLNGGLEYGIDSGYTTIEKVMKNTLKLKGSPDKLEQMFSVYNGKSCPVYSVKDLAKEVNGVKKDMYQELKPGYRPLMLNGEVDAEEVFTADINEAVSAEGDW